MEIFRFFEVDIMPNLSESVIYSALKRLPKNMQFGMLAAAYGLTLLVT